jgi:large subunit ribosomal protein L23
MNILKRPIITEKMTSLTEKLGRYGFVVDKNANKIEIKKAVESMYGVKVESVHTMVYYGKRRTRYTKTGFQSGRKNTFKKAVVTLVKGDVIDFYSNI